jgi:predicted esterase
MRGLLIALVAAACRSPQHATPPAAAEPDGAVALASAEPGGREAVARAEDGGREAVASAAVDASAGASGSAEASPSPVVTDWCVEGMRALDEDVCYVLPPLTGARPRRLLVYLHGIVPPTARSAQKETVEGAVLRASLRAGAAALVPRGRRGIGPDGARDWWAWPTAPAAHEQLVKELVARWVRAKKKLEGLVGAPFERTYLAGSSNGAYFLSALALRGDCDDLGFPIDGYGAMSGGAPGGRGAWALAGRRSRPFYVGFGTYDDETKRGARALATVFESARWSVLVREHPFGHGAREIYLDEAFAFWDGAR